MNNKSLIEDADKRINYYLQTFSQVDTNSDDQNASNSSITDASSTLTSNQLLMSKEENIPSK